MVVTAKHSKAGSIRMVGRPIKFPGSPQAPLRAAPALGEHTSMVLKAILNMSDDDIEELRGSGVVGGTPATST